MSATESERWSPAHAMLLLRAFVPLFLLVHGITRLLTGGVAGLGAFLDASHVPAGDAVAWVITVLEIVGTPLLAFGWFVPALALYYACELGAGILLVHIKAGWFVVGGGEGGMEYSVLLILAFLAIAMGAPRRSRGANTFMIGSSM